MQIINRTRGVKNLKILTLLLQKKLCQLNDIETNVEELGEKLTQRF